MELLVGGKSVAETARLAGVGRATVFRWLKNDSVFRAALNQWHDQIESGCQSRLLSLTDKAADAIEKALDAGDAQDRDAIAEGNGNDQGEGGGADGCGGNPRDEARLSESRGGSR